MTDQSSVNFQALADIRTEYRKRTLDEHEVAADPLTQFAQWMDDAIKLLVVEPTAMTLSTIDADGAPSSRVVLLKGVIDGCFAFFTNKQSAKGQAIAQHAQVALCWFWPDLERQIRVKGTATECDQTHNDEYWRHRPRRSQLGAWASAQSAELASRDELERAMREATERFEGQPVPRPPHWGGYLVRPTRVEFWQGRESRLHDRVLYTVRPSGWDRVRLAP
jgi:pyridoxamine 5'-phosphate oxidase